MTKSLSIISTVIVFASAASPLLAEPMTFTRDGVSYVANVQRLENGVTKISGNEKQSGKPFKLIISGNTVKGYYDGNRVNFITAQPGTTELSSR